MSGEARYPADTVSVLTYRMGVQDANAAGNVRGGWIMKLCDDVAAIRLAGGRVVAATVDGMRFLSPVHVGDVVALRATVNACWRSFMEVGVRVGSENVRRGEIRHVWSAYVTVVALDPEERALALRPRVRVMLEDERRGREASLRREVGLARAGELRRIESPERA